MITKTIDSRGRLLIGKQYAGRMVIIDDTDPERLVITPAVAIPEREAWLFRNPTALASLQKALDQAKKRNFASGPDLAKGAALVAELEN
jgi:hypothetical protein